MNAIVGTFVCVSLLGIGPPQEDQRLEAVTGAIQQLREENSRLVDLMQKLERKIASLEQLKAKHSDLVPDEVPEVDVMRRVPGQHVLHPKTKVPVYARSQWISYHKGRAKIYELIRYGNDIIPVSSVTWDANDSPPPLDPPPEQAEQQEPVQYFFGR